MLKKLQIVLVILAAFLCSLFVVQAATVFQTIQGGTGTSSPSGILYGSGSASPLKTVSIGSNLTFSGGTLSATDVTFSTTSALYFSSVGLAYSTTSTLADLTAYNKGFFFSTTSSLAHLTSLDKGFFFSTTSANAWGLTKGYITGIAWGEITGTLSSQSDLSAALYNKLGTTTALTSGSGVLFPTGANTVSSAATSAATVTAPITYSGTLGAFVGGVGGTFGCTTAANGTEGCITGANHTLFSSSRVATSGAETRGQLAAWGSTNGSPATLYSVATGTISATSPVTVTANRAAVGGAAVFAIDFSVANSWTGKQTFTSASSTYFSCITFCGIPTGAALAPTAAGEIAHDTTDNQFKLGTGGSTAVFDQRRFITFTYATTTAWAGTTTLPGIPLPIGFTFDSVQCKTNVGTLNTQFQYGAAASATVFPTMFSASTTMGTFTWSANNTPGAGATTTVAWGTPASSPKQVSCTITARPTGT